MAEILPFNPRRRPARMQALLPWAVLSVLCVAAVVAYWQQHHRGVEVQLGSIEAVDGDTIRANGRVFRLIGYDTPEKGLLAKCQSERLLADRATNRLRQLIAAGDLQLVQVACACAAGTEGTNRCNHGRLCAQLKVSGKDVGNILTDEGLARAYICRGTTCPIRQSWC
jgi:endonuclease YncB( thermonuclease family)